MTDTIKECLFVVPAEGNKTNLLDHILTQSCQMPVGNTCRRIIRQRALWFCDATNESNSMQRHIKVELRGRRQHQMHEAAGGFRLFTCRISFQQRSLIVALLIT